MQGAAFLFQYHIRESASTQSQVVVSSGLRNVFFSNFIILKINQHSLNIRNIKGNDFLHFEQK